MKKFLLLATMALALCAQARDGRLAERLDSLLAADYHHDGPGAALIVAIDGDVAYENYRGIADMRTCAPIDSLTRFNIASLSKQFTVVGALRLQEQGLLDIDRSVSLYVPRLTAGIWRDITPRRLMSHSSGIPDIRQRSDRDFTLYATDTQSMAFMYALDSLHFAPGTAYEYINPTFQLVAAIIERQSGEPFEQYQRRHIFGPAGMTHAQYFRGGIYMPHEAHGYIVNDGSDTGENDNGATKQRGIADGDFVDSHGTHWAECDYGEETFFATRADGGLYATARDMLRWEQALHHGTVVSAETLRQAYTPQITVSGSRWSTYQNRPHTAYGMGWFIDTAPVPGRGTKIYHTGDNGGFQAYIAKFDLKGHRVNVIMLENCNNNDRWQTQTLIEQIIAAEL